MFEIDLHNVCEVRLSDFFAKHKIIPSNFEETKEGNYKIIVNKHTVVFKNAEFAEFDGCGRCLFSVDNFVYTFDDRYNNYTYYYADEYYYSLRHECYIYEDDCAWCEDRQDYFYNSDLVMCEHCHDYFFENDVRADEYGDYYCENCEYFGDFGVEERDERIRGYGDNPKLKFFGNKKSNLFFGLEIEIECLRMEETEALDILEREELFFKEDASINEGFEIVTHPMQFDYIYQNDVFKDFEKLRKNLNSVRGHNAGGIHIHVSRNAFLNNNHLRKFLYFFNKKDNRNFILKISQRRESNLMRWADFGKNEYYQNLSNLIDKSLGRYTAINLSNEDTVEIRIFNSNLREARILKNLEFVDAVFHFSRNCKKMDKKEFIKFVKKSKKYANLNNFLIEKNII